MHWAARKGNPKMIKIFHEFGAEVDPKDLVRITSEIMLTHSSIAPPCTSLV